MDTKLKFRNQLDFLNLRKNIENIETNRQTNCSVTKFESGLESGQSFV